MYMDSNASNEFFQYLNKKLLTIHLTIIGITLFLLMFEARARYLLLYAL